MVVSDRGAKNPYCARLLKIRVCEPEFPRCGTAKSGRVMN